MLPGSRSPYPSREFCMKALCIKAPRAGTLALVTALVLAGCKTKAAGPDKPEASSKPAPAAKDTAAKPASSAAAPAAAAKPAAAPGSLGDIVQNKSVRDQHRAQLVQSYSQMGETAFAESRFDDAQRYFRDVLDLDPKNDGARRRLSQLGAMLGNGVSDARGAFDDAVNNTTVRGQQAKVQVSNLVADARAKEKVGDYESAIDLYDRALTIVQLFPGNVDFEPNEAGLKTLKAKAKETGATTGEALRAKKAREIEERVRLEARAQRAARQNRIDQMMRSANQAMEGGQYQSAHNLANAILEIDPQNGTARQLRTLSLNAANDAADERQKSLLVEEWKHTFERLNDAVTPQVKSYEFPDTWATDQALRTAPSLTNATAAEDPKDREVRNRIASARTSVNFEAVKLEQAVEFLTRISGANIVILPAAREGKSEEELTIASLKLENPLPVEQILTLVTKLSGLAWNVENGVVQITTAEAARGAMIVQLYDVKDIATPISNFPGSDINIDPTGELTTVEEAPEAIPEFQVDAIQELITTNVDKAIWESGGEVSSIPPGTLVVKAPAATQAKVQSLLAGLRGAGGLQVSIETRFVTVSDNFLQDIGVDLRGLGDQSGGVGVAGKGGINGPGGTLVPVSFDDVFFGTAGAPASVGTGNDVGVFYNMNSDGDIRARFENLYDSAFNIGKQGVLTQLGGLSFQGTLIDDTQLEVILRAVEKSDRSTVVLAPKLTAYNGQRANLTVLNQISYISDFDVEIAQAAQIGDPIVQTLRDGVILDLRPVVTSDRRFITMELRPTIAIVTRPIATFQTTLANGPPVTIQLPELQVQRVRTTVTMPDGGTLLLGGLKFFEERRAESTVPWLGDVPIMSFVFSRKGTYTERKNLLVLIRAEIVRPEENEPTARR